MVKTFYLILKKNGPTKYDYKKLAIQYTQATYDVLAIPIIESFNADADVMFALCEHNINYLNNCAPELKESSDFILKCLNSNKIPEHRKSFICDHISDKLLNDKKFFEQYTILLANKSVGYRSTQVLEDVLEKVSTTSPWLISKHLGNNLIKNQGLTQKICSYFDNDIFNEEDNKSSLAESLKNIYMLSHGVFPKITSFNYLKEIASMQTIRQNVNYLNKDLLTNPDVIKEIFAPDCNSKEFGIFEVSSPYSPYPSTFSSPVITMNKDNPEIINTIVPFVGQEYVSKFINKLDIDAEDYDKILQYTANNINFINLLPMNKKDDFLTGESAMIDSVTKVDNDERTILSFNAISGKFNYVVEDDNLIFIDKHNNMIQLNSNSTIFHPDIVTHVQEMIEVFFDEKYNFEFDTKSFKENIISAISSEKTLDDIINSYSSEVQTDTKENEEER